MNAIVPQCQNLESQVDSLLSLASSESNLSDGETTSIRHSLGKAISPRFEIVFAGAFSAGKSMLINALLERELLYSAQGHATGTECYIEYSPNPNQERVVLTFLSEAEIRQQVAELSQLLDIELTIDIGTSSDLEKLIELSQNIWQQEGGESRSDRAKQAKSLEQLLLGFKANRDRIHPSHNATASMEQLNATSLEDASQYARRSENSSVLKKIQYYCHHPLLEDGNVIIDTPGIDAPVKKDAQIAYNKIEHPDTSAVICVFKTAANGELTTEETQLLERIQNNPSIRDRVFYAFNYIDATWYDSQLQNRLNYHLKSQFAKSDRIYKTSALLGFYGSQVRQAGSAERWGLNSIFGDSHNSNNPTKNTPKFLVEFNNYYFTSGRASRSRFPITADIGNAETHAEKYLQILDIHGDTLIEQLVRDSGVEDFRKAISRYLMEDRRPQLFETLANDLRPLCINLRNHYLEVWRNLESQPQELDAIKQQQVKQLNHDLNRIANAFEQYVADHLNQAVASNQNVIYERDFRELQKRMLQKLDDLISDFSVGQTYQLAQKSHPEDAVVPLLAILVEAFYYLSNQLKQVLVDASQNLVVNFFEELRESIREAEFYSDLYRLLGNDGGIDRTLQQLQDRVREAVKGEARTECGSYVRETPEFYGEGTVPNFQLRQTLQEACHSSDYHGMVAAEPAIRQLLKVDFEQKVKQTVLRRFRTKIDVTLNDNLLDMAKQQAQEILSQYELARTHLDKTLDREAQTRLDRNHQLKEAVQKNIDTYNDAVAGINACLEEMGLGRGKLPPILSADLEVLPPVVLSSVEPATDGEVEETASEEAIVEAELEVNSGEFVFEEDEDSQPMQTSDSDV